MLDDLYRCEAMVLLGRVRLRLIGKRKARKMAIARRFAGIDKVTISFVWAGTLTTEHRVGVSAETFDGPPSVLWLFSNVEAIPGGITVTDQGFQIEKILLRCAVGQLLMQISEESTGERLFVDPLYFDHSFFMPFFDFARIERYPPFIAPRYERPELLAVFTHVYNEDDLVTMWERHYSKLVPYNQLYVIDHGSSPSPRAMLNEATNVISIPRGVVDHANIAGFCNYFQRFLFTQYRWVIHVDCDEFLIHERGTEALLSELADTRPDVIIRPSHAYELIHDYRSELPLVSSEPVSTQRRVLMANAAYRKPVLSSVPTTWGLGFHYAHEDHVVVSGPTLWMIHLAFADLERSLLKQVKWLGLRHSEADTAFVSHTARTDTREELQNRFDERLAAPGIDVPQWMHGMF